MMGNPRACFLLFFIPLLVVIIHHQPVFAPGEKGFGGGFGQGGGGQFPLNSLLSAGAGLLAGNLMQGGHNQQYQQGGGYTNQYAPGQMAANPAFYGGGTGYQQPYGGAYQQPGAYGYNMPPQYPGAVPGYPPQPPMNGYPAAAPYGMPPMGMPMARNQPYHPHTQNMYPLGRNQSIFTSYGWPQQHVKQQHGMGRTQSAGARLVLLCNNVPAMGVQVVLKEKDTGVDDTFQGAKTQADGSVQVVGADNEWGSIKPYLNIYPPMRCNHGNMRREIKVWIPPHFINQGHFVTDWFTEVFELSDKFKAPGFEDTFDFFHSFGRR